MIKSDLSGTETAGQNRLRLGIRELWHPLLIFLLLYGGRRRTCRPGNTTHINEKKKHYLSIFREYFHNSDLPIWWLATFSLHWCGICILLPPSQVEGISHLPRKLDLLIERCWWDCRGHRLNPVQGFKQGDGLIARRDVVGILRFNKKKKWC